MNTKPKPCNGTGKAKGYGCGSIELVRTYGLGYSCGCYPKWLYSTKEGQAKVKRATLSATKDSRELKEEEQRLKDEKSLSYLLINTRTVCHNYIRKRDKGKPCISCGAKWRPNFQAGHFYKAELYSTLKFHEDNIHGQCPKCNIREEGNLSPYSVNLPERIGKDAFDSLNALAAKEKQTNHKWDKEELNKIREKYKKLLKSLE